MRVEGKGGRQRIVPTGRLAAEAARRYLARGRPLPRQDARSPARSCSTRAAAASRARACSARARPRRRGGHRAGRHAARPAPLLRDPPARARRRPARRAGAARPRVGRHDRDLHAPRRRRAAQRRSRTRTLARAGRPRRGRLPAWAGERSSWCSTPSGRASCPTPRSSATRARTRSATSRARSAASSCRTCRSSASATCCRSRAARRRATAPSVAGRLLEHSLGKDTTVGHWEIAGDRDRARVPDLSGRASRRTSSTRSRAATGRGVIGNVAASGTEIIERLGEEHQRTGKWIVYTSADSVFQIAAHEDDGAARGALRGLPDRARAADRRARRRARDRAPVRGRARATTAAPRTATTSRSCRRGRTGSRASARAGGRVTGVGKIGDIFAGQDIDDSLPDALERRRPGADGRARARGAGDGLIFVNLVETDMIYGHRNDPPGFHRCLQEIDAAIPGSARRARPRRPAAADLRPRLRPDDGVDRSLARVRAADRARARPRAAARATTASSPTSARPPLRGSARATGDGLPGTPIDLGPPR